MSHKGSSHGSSTAVCMQIKNVYILNRSEKMTVSYIFDCVLLIVYHFGDERCKSGERFNIMYVGVIS